MTRHLTLAAIVSVWLLQGSVQAQAPKLDLRKGDRVVFMGDTFAEREAMFGYIETMLHAQFPEHKLTFRNLAYPADTPKVLLADLEGTHEYNHGSNRALNFGTMTKHLSDVKADVIILCLGMAASLESKGKVDDFAKDLQSLLKAYGDKQFNGKSPPRFVLVGPIAHEKLGGAFPDPAEHNDTLGLFNDAMRQVAKSNKIPFVDLFQPMSKLMEKNPGDKFTFNGIHVNEYGQWALSQLFAEALSIHARLRGVGVHDKGAPQEFGYSLQYEEALLPLPLPPPGVKLHPVLKEKLFRVSLVQQSKVNAFTLVIGDQILQTETAADWAKGVILKESPMHDIVERLRRTIIERNQEWFHLWRAVNGEYVYGRRAKPFGVVNFPDEMGKLHASVEALDQSIFQQNKILPKTRWSLLTPKGLLKGNFKPRQLGVKTPLPEVQQVYNQKQGIIGGKEVSTAKDPEEARKLFKLQDGYEINLFASEKDFPIHNPIAMAWDAKGRLWVTTMPSYPHYLPGSPPNDKILILEDTDGDGKADKCTVFADGFYLPTGIEFGEGGVYVGAQPNILFLKDTNGDDVADTREVILHGFGTGDSHHAVHAFTRTPDGALLIHEGIFHRTNVETPHGVMRQHDAAIWRFSPKSHKLDLYVSYNFANPWGHVFDKWGFNFIADASGGANYNALPITGHLDFPRQHPSMKVFTQPIVRPTCGCELISSRHFPPETQGNFIFNNCIGFQGIKQFKVSEEGSGFTSKELEPLLVSKDPNFRPVALKFGPDGALYIVDWYNPLIGHMQHSIRDPGRDHYHGRVWRITAKGRPLVKAWKIAGAKIGALLDQLESPADGTRYRVRAELRERKTADVVLSIDRWLMTLGEVAEQNEHLLLEALWVQQSHDAVNPELFQRLLRAKDYRVRAAATRLLRVQRPETTLTATRFEYLNEIFDQFAEGRGYFLISEGALMRRTLEEYVKANGNTDGKIKRQEYLEFHAHLHGSDTLSLLQEQINDVHPRVRLEAVVALSFFKGPRAAEIALEVLKHPMDYYLDYGLKETMTTLEPYWKPVLAAGKPFAANHLAGISYVLANVSNDDLSKMPPSEAVCLALLARPSVHRDQRNHILASLARLRKSQPLEQLLKLMDEFDSGKAKPHGGVDHTAHVGDELGGLLPLQPIKDLQQARDKLEKMAFAGKQALTRRWAMAGLIVAERSTKPIFELSRKSPGSMQDFFEAVPLVPDAQRRAEAFSAVEDVVMRAYFGLKGSEQVLPAALQALAAMPGRETEAIIILSGQFRNKEVRDTAVRTLRRLPTSKWPQKQLRPFVDELVNYLKELPAKDRTEIAALDALQLGNDLAALLPAAQAKVVRAQLADLGVNVILMRTVPHLMLYDRPKFYVEAGKPVVVVFENTDIMPHNLLIAAPGSLAEIGLLSEKFANDPAFQAKGYVPAGKKVLHATRMLQPREADRLTFIAPKEPGQYVYVCTFPGHWRVMNGVMHVVPKLADVPAGELNPPPTVVTEARPFVRNWTVEELTPELINLDKNRSFEKGKALFKAASCVQCHKMNKEGGDLGPDLAETAKKLAELKMSKIELVREVIEPSRTILDKYKPRTFITSDGRVVSGLVLARDKKVVRVANIGWQLGPIDLAVADIEEESESKISIMPDRLLVTLQREEIYELLAYIVAGGDAGHPLYRRKE